MPIERHDEVNRGHRDLETAFRKRGRGYLRRSLIGLAGLCLSLLCLAITTSAAFADRAYDSQITGFVNPQGLAIDGQDNVWIDDYGNAGTISEYDAYPSQTLLGTQTGDGNYGGYILSIAHNNSTGYLFVADSGPVDIDVFDNTGAFSARWPTENSCGVLHVAVDNSGTVTNGRVYIGRTCEGPQHIQALNAKDEPEDFSGTASYITENHITGTPGGAIGSISNIATDEEGNFYVVDQSKGVVDEFAASGIFVQEFAGTGAPGGFSSNLSGVAVDPTNGNVLVVDSGNNVVDEFSSSGEYLDQLTGTAEGSAFGSLTGGIAVNSEGYVYVSDGAGTVDIFTPNVVLPKIASETATNITRTAATLSANVDPNEGGNVESCHFEYGPTNAYGSSAPCSPTTPYSTATAVSASITGLSTETTYHYRVVVGNLNGTKRGRDQVFTPHFVTGISTDAATSVEKTRGTLNGSFVGNGEDTHYFFEWGESESYGNITAVPPGEDAGSPAGPAEVSAELEGLSAEVTYHFRIVATNGLGTSHGEDLQFTTLGPAVASLETEAATQIKAGGAQLNGSFVGNGEDTHYYFEWGEDSSYGHKTSVPPGEDAGSPAGPSLTKVSAALSGLVSETAYHYRFVASNGMGTTHGSDQMFTTTGAVGELRTEEATNITATGATLNGSFNAEPLDTHYYFLYNYQQCIWNEFGVLETCNTGPTEEAPIGGADAGVPSGPMTVSTNVDLAAATTYHYRIIASNSLGSSSGEERSFKTPPAPPGIRHALTSEVHTDTATVAAEINPGESATTSEFEPGTKATSYHVEYGPADCAVNVCASTPEVTLGPGTTFKPVSVQLPALAAGTTYHWRVVAKNENPSSPTISPDETFTTYPSIDLGHDSCPNAHVRQQTGAAGLLDCRAYELVSAANTGGYDVESGLVAGQSPYGGYPQAEDPSRVLYGVHDGAIPGVGAPTNRGVDPYVATRGEDGWTTEYVGIPSDVNPTSGPFASTLGEADAGLDTFAFVGSGLCRPCFTSGIETGIPVHLPNGQLVQGMAGSLDPGPSSEAEGFIGKDLSADGTHLIFGSKAQFEPDANNNGDLSIYDRDLATSQTHVVSKTPAGATMTGPDIAELDVSSDGSHILVAQKVAEDADHNVYYHPYMDIGDSTRSIDLAPGGTHGVLYDGMTADGSKVFFTSTDRLSSDDTDSSADIYEAELNGESATLTRISTGAEGTGNSDACDPVANSNGEHWNTPGASADCGVVAIGGGGGIGAQDGSIYFLSPELLDGASNGTANQPNLYVAPPGQSPRFIATLAPNDPVVLDSVKEAATRHSADFQATPSGAFAAFSTSEPLDSSYDNAGHGEIYRYGASGEGLDCISCDPTGLEPTGESNLATKGLSLTDDGRVFFTSDEALVARDGDHRKDVYEWKEGKVELISAGTSSFDSSLLGVSANGTDVYFFTHDSLVPQDANGDLVKIYDARAFGGLPYTPVPVQCKASDECHGAGTAAPEPPAIHSGVSSGGNVPVKKDKSAKRHRRHHRKRRHHKPTHRKHG